MNDGARAIRLPAELDIRDYFAGQALAFWANAQIGGWFGDFPKDKAEQIGRHAYIVADAMMAARNIPKEHLNENE